MVVRISKNTIDIDTGIGVSPDELQHAFEPFYRGERSRATSVGHGLGLSIVRRLVHQFDYDLRKVMWARVPSNDRVFRRIIVT